MTREELIKHLKTTALKTPTIIEAFENVDRGDFVLPEYKDAAYEDYPLPIGGGGTISQPYTVAFMLELLQPQVGDKVLDIGSGSGWTTALLAHIVSQKGGQRSNVKGQMSDKVIGLEIVPELVEFGRKNLAKYGFKNAEIRQADAGVVGLPTESPFDKILVSASAVSLPQELVDQLAPGGKLVLPIATSIWLIEKDSASQITQTEFPGFVFVPLR